MDIKIIKKLPAKFDGPVKELIEISLRVGGHRLTINGVKMIDAGKGVFFALPQRQHADKDGSTKYSPICGFFDSAASKDFQSSMRSAYHEFLKNPPQDQQPQDQQPQDQQPQDQQKDDSHSSSFYIGNPPTPPQGFNDEDLPF